MYVYSPFMVRSLVYMLQASEYKIVPYALWVVRTRSFQAVENRRTITWTAKAALLILIGLGAYVLLLSFGFYELSHNTVIGVLVVALTPTAIFILLAVVTVCGYYLFQRPHEKRMYMDTQLKLANHPARKIAILGSYGKTTMKESLATILGEGMHVAASPGNMNTPIGISRFVSKLDGSEDVLLFELGEEKKGDIAYLSELVQPEFAIITGISPAHLESFGDMQTLISTLCEIDKIPTLQKLYINGESDYVNDIHTNHQKHWYTKDGCGKWKIQNISSSLSGTTFEIQNGAKLIWARTFMLGDHSVGPLAACVDIANTLHLELTEISEGIGHTKPYAHRLEPRVLHGATIIDDTYNGNITGVEVGLRLLKSSDANRKIYITPGLVEQGGETKSVHEKMGELIADAGIDIVILIQNSTTRHILDGMKRTEFNGIIKIENDPLHLYGNLDHLVAKGDVVLMQNDWTDNYV